MPTSVNVFTSGWVATGSSISVPQFSENIMINWRNDSGASQTWTGIVKFPDILLTIYGASPLWAVGQMQELVYQFGRKQLGIDP